jgi:hypothetical protein
MTERTYSKKTKVYWTCAALIAGRKISVQDEIGEVMGWRLPAIIDVLKNKHYWPINADLHPVRRITYYSLADGCDLTSLRYPMSARSLLADLRRDAANDPESPKGGPLDWGKDG